MTKPRKFGRISLKNMKKKAAGPGKRVYLYHLDENGNWRYGRNPFEDPELARQFFRDIQEGADGSYFVDCEGERCLVRVADAPSFVEAIEVDILESPGQIMLYLASGVREPLQPETLFTGASGALYCEDSRGLRTKFLKKAHLDLAKRIQEKDGEYILFLGGRGYRIRQER